MAAASVVPASVARTEPRSDPTSRSTRLALMATAAWRANTEASSMSRRLKAASVPLVEDLEHADRAVLVDERDRHDRARHVAGLPRRTPGRTAGRGPRRTGPAPGRSCRRSRPAPGTAGRTARSTPWPWSPGGDPEDEAGRSPRRRGRSTQPRPGTGPRSRRRSSGGPPRPTRARGVAPHRPAGRSPAASRAPPRTVGRRSPAATAGTLSAEAHRARPPTARRRGRGARRRV